MHQPFLNLIIYCSNVVFTNLSGIICGKTVPLRCEETVINRVWIWTAEQFYFGYIVGRRHTRIGGMELIIKSFLFQVIIYDINPFGNDQNRTGSFLGDEIAERPAY